MKLTTLAVITIAAIAAAGTVAITNTNADGARQQLLHGQCHPIAHRGIHDAQIDEETAPAILHAPDYGAAAELDIRVTTDGQFVAMHDRTVNRTTDGHGPIEAMTYPEAQQLRTAHNYPPVGLDTALQIAKAYRVPLLLEVKDYRTWWTEQDLAAFVDQLADGGPHVRVTGVPAVLKWLKRQAPQVSTYSVSAGRGKNVRDPDLAAKRSVDLVMLVRPLRSEVLALRAAGYKVAVSAPDRASLKKQVRWGARLFWTDKPAQLRAWCK